MSAPLVVGPPTAAETAYRAMMGAFPTGVAVVTALDRSGRPHGLTCTSLTSVSLHPPTLLICLDLRSGTLGAVRDQGGFGVNLLHERARATAEMFASPAADRFDRVAWQPGDTVGAPWLSEDAFARAECRTTELLPTGDHAIVLGEVVGIAQAPDVPLLYGERRFAAFPGPRVSSGQA